MKKIAEYTATSLETVRDKFETIETGEAKALKPVHITKEATYDATTHQDTVLALALTSGGVRELLAEITEDMLATEERRAVLHSIRRSTKVAVDTPKDLQEYDTYVKILLLKADTRYGQWSDEDRYAEVARLVRLIITEHKQTRKNELTKALREAEDVGDEAVALKLRQELNELIKELPRAKR